MAQYTGRRARRRVPKIWMSDGNHRAYAAFLRGSPAARFYVPLNEWRLFQTVLGRATRGPAVRIRSGRQVRLSIFEPMLFAAVSVLAL